MEHVCVCMQTYIMTPFYFVYGRVCVDYTVKVYIGAFPDVVRIEGGTEDNPGFRDICNQPVYVQLETLTNNT